MVKFKLFQKLENPKHPLLGPNVFFLKSCGFLMPKRMLYRFFWKLWKLFIISYSITEFIPYYQIINNKNILISNLKITTATVICMLKFFSFLFYENQWRIVINYSSKAEIRDRLSSETSKNMKTIIHKYTSFSRIISYVYLLMISATIGLLILQPLLKFVTSSTYREEISNGLTSEPIVKSWTPWDRSTAWGNSISYILEIAATSYTGIMLLGFDTIAIVLMAFFGGQIDLLKCRCVNIFVSTDDIARKRIIECHLIHLELIEHARIFNSLLSPIMFIKIFTSSVMLCATAYQVLIMEVDNAERVVILQYLAYIVTHLFVYCWQSSEVYYKSEGLLRAPYESLWYTKNLSFRKDMSIMTEQFRRPLAFTAGPFSALTLSTFINIIKGAYSYYTILSKS